MLSLPMTRRTLLTALPGLRAAPKSASITRIVITPIQGRFHKFVSMNSYDTQPKGETYTNTLLRIQTSEGVEGIGATAGAANEAFQRAARTLLGADALSLYRMEAGRIVGRAPQHAAVLEKYPHLDGPLFDLIGKLTGKPCWQLIGPSARDRVEVYDGTVYFADVWFKDKGVRAVVEEAEESARAGYLGVKLKLGRGSKWMEKEAGLLRDIEISNSVRRAVGPKMKVLVDANNGYRDDFDRAWRLVDATRESNLHWLEELFPEDVAHYTELRRRMAAAGMKTLIADGETVGEVKAFEPFLQSTRLIDVVQMDIRRGGFLANLELARMAARVGATSVPHNWGSHLGLLMGLHFAKAVPNAPAAEDDRSRYDVIATEGYRFAKGDYTVSNAPGLGVRIDEDVYRRRYQAAEIALR
jgi:L-alanine-DL-glutamate epimerase-like enolase superfamily enzyme